MGAKVNIIMWALILWWHVSFFVDWCAGADNDYVDADILGTMRLTNKVANQ